LLELFTVIEQTKFSINPELLNCLFLKSFSYIVILIYEVGKNSVFESFFRLFN
jgi:hypothetical protein